MSSSRVDRGRGSAIRDGFQTQLWPLPIVGIVVATVLGVGVPLLDAAADGTVPRAVSAVLFSGGPDAARTVLSAVAGSLVTVTSLTFSLTVVTLQLASSQFSPRLLRTFSRDRFVHSTLAIFLATFVYTLIVLRTVRNDADSRGAFVPEFSVTLAVLATVASVVFLVLFLAHLSSQIRVETILERVRHEADDTLERTLRHRGDASGSGSARPSPGRTSDSSPVLAPRTGFLASVDEQALLAAACETDAVVVIEGFPGGSLIAGTPLGRSWSTDGTALAPDAQESLGERVGRAIQIGPERTAAQDIAFGLRQLTDVTDKALSPGINDPTTAVHALGHISGVLCHALDFDLGPRILHDDDGALRVVLERPGFRDLLDSAIAQPRRFGSDSPNVLSRIARLLRELAWNVRTADEAAAVREQADRLTRTVTGGSLQKTEVAELTTSIKRIEDALDGRW